jgi:hypothetical protein
MRTQTIPQQTVVEDIVNIDHNLGNFVRLMVGNGIETNGKFELLPSQTLETIIIADIPGGIINEDGSRSDITDYTELMSANPTWAPQKPGGVFRKDDLWHFVDLIRSRT